MEKLGIGGTAVLPQRRSGLERISAAVGRKTLSLRLDGDLTKYGRRAGRQGSEGMVGDGH